MRYRNRRFGLVVTDQLPALEATLHNTDQYGWAKYVLPTGSVYYNHPRCRVVTDINPETCEHADFLQDIASGETLPKGWELWLSPHSTGNSPRMENNMVRHWVNHEDRLFTTDYTIVYAGRVVEEKDSSCIFHFLSSKTYPMCSVIVELGMELHYWEYIVAHPAHVTLGKDAYTKAINMLDWIYAGKP